MVYVLDVSLTIPHMSLLQALPGGFVSRVNNTCIQVLDSVGDGVFFLLNDDDRNINDKDDVEEDTPEIMYVAEYPEVEYVDVDGNIPEVDFIAYLCRFKSFPFEFIK